jgi:ABC-type transport system involved in multi-copper enzyme maturation permease subunit
MPPWFNSTVAWLRRQFAWSNSRRSWQERFGIAALAVSLGLGWYVSRSWSIEFRVFLLASWLLVLAILLRRGLIKLFGPVFFYEALRGTRQRVHLYRIIYAAVLLIVVGWVWLANTQGGTKSFTQIKEQAEFAQTIFFAYFIVQMAVIVLLTPIAIASAIAEEKERRTLEFMLATDLRGREILLGKLAGRMAHMTLYLLAGLPIVALLQLLGGIDPDLLLASFAVTILTFVSLAALSILFSTLMRRSRDAIVITCIAIFAYHILSGSLYLLLQLNSLRSWSMVISDRVITAEQLIDFANGGNLITQVVHVIKAMEFGGQDIGTILRSLLEDYTLFHLTATVVCLVWAMARLRPVAKAQMTGGVTRKGRTARAHPEIGHWPMIWKEVFANAGRMHWLQKIVLAALLLVSLVPPVWITVEHFWDLMRSLPYDVATGPADYWRDPWHQYGIAMNAWVRSMSGLIGSMLLVAVALRAAVSITGERSRQTLDELLTTPLSNFEIVLGKWLGAILSVRRGLIWIGMVFLVGMITGGLNPIGAAAAAVAWLAFASAFAGIGLWFSIHSKTTFRATVYTLLTVLFLLGFHWFLTFFCYALPSIMSGGSETEFMKFVASAQLGVTPPATLSILPFSGAHELNKLGEEWERILFFQGVGIAIYVAAAAFCVPLLSRRFGDVFSRNNVRRPEAGDLGVAGKLFEPMPAEGDPLPPSQPTASSQNDSGT